VLINNAGGHFALRKITVEGIERTFALNHMAYFVLTQCLQERLMASVRRKSDSSQIRGH
jgi:NAD(P)-dependent dehydrogenase (short-subunit alcohol dehydrogenase family)